MQERLHYIDGLRGLAICGVVLVHAGQSIAGLPAWAHALSDYGGRGVQLFFLLSALTLLSINSGRPFCAKAFFIRRLFRIAPMFWLAAAFYLIFYGTGPGYFAPQGIGLRQVTLTLLFLHGWMFDSINSIVPGGWSIADEAMFYLLFPLLLFCITNDRRVAIFLAIAVVISRISFAAIPQWWAGAAPAGLLDSFALFCFPTNLAAFAGGFAACFLIGWFQQHPEYAHKNYASVVFYAAFALLFLCAVSGNPTLSNYLLADMLFIPLVIGAGLAQPRILINAPMQHIGRVSYSIYLIHFFVLYIVSDHLLPCLSFSPCFRLAILFFSVLALSTLAATVTYRCIELPMMALGRKWSERSLLRFPHPAGSK